MALPGWCGSAPIRIRSRLTAEAAPPLVNSEPAILPIASCSLGELGLAPLIPSLPRLHCSKCTPRADGMLRRVRALARGVLTSAPSWQVPRVIPQGRRHDQYLVLRLRCWRRLSHAFLPTQSIPPPRHHPTPTPSATCDRSLRCLLVRRANGVRWAFRTAPRRAPGAGSARNEMPGRRRPESRSGEELRRLVGLRTTRWYSPTVTTTHGRRCLRPPVARSPDHGSSPSPRKNPAGRGGRRSPTFANRALH
jgi:hypothetical protein